MKQITVISGKGGTGKTTITAAFGSLAKNAVFADCDVDAPDLHLIFKPDIKKEINFYGMKIAEINKNKCIKCMKCYENCKFEAISENLEINELKCEGCGVCEYLCPVEAIDLKDKVAGKIITSDCRFGPFSHGMLNIAEEASGKLVAKVRENARILARKHNKDIIVIDGPPGTGCPVIASITGVDAVLIVTEPTLSGIADMKRILNVTEHFKIPYMVCINKWDINKDNSRNIEDYCKERNIKFAGRISYNKNIVKAMINEMNIFEYLNQISVLYINSNIGSDMGFNKTANEIKSVWEFIIKRMD